VSTERPVSRRRANATTEASLLSWGSFLFVDLEASTPRADLAYGFAGVARVVADASHHAFGPP
jgi:hypothetical protein